jgi:hypothetical protein
VIPTHVTKTALFLQRGWIVERAVAGEQTLLHSHKAHHRKLKTLAAVQGHQGDPFSFGVFAIGIAGNVLQG